ncbi:hypothetical protein IP91_04281 [Pseudoduganella lurida]|uniref:Uncharacterized protein n=1 Tax=Pseudoduganella lurida TaxID=1036180 RepID=A0A562QZD7_9BURK|nr:hypothetical protein [Pseudoduganella lurida]TWI62172.1 hypothetical protein IP91_04281 [Pseudoduganella lurida]
MKHRAGRALLLCALLGALPCATTARAAPARDKPFEFVVIGHAFAGGTDDADLKRTLVRADRLKPAFVVAAGIKSAEEPCSDKLYAQRRALLDQADQPLLLVLSGSDWTGCRNSAGRSNAIERLNRIREIYFDEEALGETRLELSRQSMIAKFRSYAENAHWEVRNVLFATINLPAPNNHYLLEAGRNSEYEDRLVANRAWLQRLFSLAKRRKLDGLVLFSDGDVRIHAEQGFSLLSGFSTKQDGFAETRRLIRVLAEKYPGKVLLVDTHKPAAAEPVAEGAVAPGTLTWRGNLGHVTLPDAWHVVRVTPGDPVQFAHEAGHGEEKTQVKGNGQPKPPAGSAKKSSAKGERPQPPLK